MRAWIWRGALSACLLGAGAGESAAQDLTSPHGALPTDLDCSACHTPERWTPAKLSLDFDHDTQTDFRLEGLHAQADCTACHLSLDFTQPKLEGDGCASCHFDVHQGKLGTDCVSCHTANSFLDLPVIDLHANTFFPLTGAHLQVSCESCHADERRGSFAGQDPECLSCHGEAYQATANPSHAEQGFSSACEQCHGTVAWTNGDTFAHERVAGGFQLIGAHARAQCASCHVLPTLEPFFHPASGEDCVTCHREEYDGEHAGSGFPETCLNCHTQETWSGATFDHQEASGGMFPLLGVHIQTDCAGCHIEGTNEPRFQASGANDCVACHQVEYDQQHLGAGFSTQCLDCHTVDTWQGASFDHTSVSGGFTLIGAHQNAACASCHSLPDNGVPWTPAGQNDCVACHQTEYDQQHAGSGFSTQCLDCHTVDTWQGATFDHDALYFSIYSGRHQGIWQNDCATCHTTPGDFSQFSCFQCHAHRQSKMDDEHSEVSGYVYDSPTCLTCHPTGND